MFSRFKFLNLYKPISNKKIKQIWYIFKFLYLYIYIYFCYDHDQCFVIYIYTDFYIYIDFFNIFCQEISFFNFIYTYIYIYQNIFFGKNWKHETFEVCKRITKITKFPYTRMMDCLQKESQVFCVNKYV